MASKDKGATKKRPAKPPTLTGKVRVRLRRRRCQLLAQAASQSLDAAASLLCRLARAPRPLGRSPDSPPRPPQDLLRGLQTEEEALQRIHSQVRKQLFLLQVRGLRGAARHLAASSLAPVLMLWLRSARGPAQEERSPC
jgi:hypothetical protein